MKEHGKELKLILDCRARSSSLLEMLERSLILEKQVKLALMQPGVSFPFDVIEIRK